MNLKYVKTINTTELFVDVDNLEYIIKREYSSDSLMLLQQLQQLATQVNIPEILEIEVNEHNITTYERYIDGLTIQEMIDNQKFITKQQLDSYVHQLTVILQAIHQSNIIHKDIKPDNIVVKDNIIYLIDFNISRMYKQTQSKDTQLFGTEGFASPEQYGFSQTTEKSDIYSLGKTIQQMLQITITTPNEYDQYSSLTQQMTSLDPKMRVELNQVDAIMNGPKSKKIIPKLIKASKPFPGIIQTSGNILIQLIATYVFITFTYDLFVSELVLQSKSIWYVCMFITYYIATYTTNISLLPHTRKMYQQFEHKNIIFRCIWWFTILIFELFCFAVIITIVIDIINSLI